MLGNFWLLATLDRARWCADKLLASAILAQEPASSPNPTCMMSSVDFCGDRGGSRIIRQRTNSLA